MVVAKFILLMVVLIPCVGGEELSGGSGDRERVLIVFYSYPEEASLTAIFRGYEVCSPSRIVILSSRRRGDELRGLVDRIGGVLRGVELDPRAVVPDVDTSLEEIPRIADEVRRSVLRDEGIRSAEICFVASAGSRLEVASISMVLDRERTRVLYVSFLWGPWKGAFYPYTPKPLEIVHEIHGCGTELRQFNAVHEPPLRDVLRASELRRAVLEAQFRFNKDLCCSPCYATIDGVDCRCRGLRIEFR